MNHSNRLSLKDSYRLLARLPLTEKNDQELEALIEQILGLRDCEEAHRLLLQHHRD